MSRDFSFEALTTDAFKALVDGAQKLVVLLPVGSVEPHGPHLSLLTDTVISQASAELAAERLVEQGVSPLIAPAVPYGVTDCAAGFKGAVSIPETVLSDFLVAVVKGFLSNGVDHVCVINNHLEPEQYRAVLAVAAAIECGRVSVACPLSRRWARTLSNEFKRGECHAGRYETSIVMAAEKQGVIESIRKRLPEVPVSLSDKLREGVNDFKSMGMDRAYAGAPALATEEEGLELLDKLATMIVTEVMESLCALP